MTVKSFNKASKINIITLGCSKNIVDSEVLLTQLRLSGFDVVYESSEDDAEIVIINTCGFINDAKEESIETILRFAEAKKKGLIRKLYVIGCLSERYKDDLQNEITEVDGYFGVNKLTDILKAIKAEYTHDLISERFIATPSHYAYLKISEGCNRKCSFCAIPSIRGKYVSKPVEEILREVTLLAQKGVKELILIAQDLTDYGWDIYRKRNLAELIEKISTIKGIEWIRLQYAYPANFPFNVLKVIKNNPKVCKYIDIPFQHISDKLLKSMRRGIAKDGVISLINRIRKEIPDVALRTSLIVGYPSETEKDFNELIEFVKSTGFERLGVFTYSHEENTKAFELKDNISKKIKQQRVNELMEVQRDISYKLNKSKIGKTFKVIFDRLEGDYYIGRTEFDSPEVDNEVLVEKKGNNKIRIGEFSQIKVTSADDYDLFGVLA